MLPLAYTLTRLLTGQPELLQWWLVQLDLYEDDPGNFPANLQKLLASRTAYKEI